jgi:hypothetical protein
MLTVNLYLSRGERKTKAVGLVASSRVNIITHVAIQKETLTDKPIRDPYNQILLQMTLSFSSGFLHAIELATIKTIAESVKNL